VKSTIRVLAVAVAIGLFLLLVWGIETTTPNSTAGIVDLGNNVAKVPAGETFVLTHKSGKTRKTWEITYDDKAGVVYFHCVSSWCNDLTPARLCGVGCVVNTKTGLWDYFHTTLRDDGTVSVNWPWGWNYRPYKP
jgi:hypothetical protein